MSSSTPVSSQSPNVYAPVFVAHEHYSCKNACLWGIFKAHVDVVLGRDQKTPQPLINRVIHLVLAALELLPVIGQIVSLVEYAVENILHTRKEKQAVALQTQKEKEALAKYAPAFNFIKNKSTSSGESAPCSDTDFRTCVNHIETMQKVGAPLDSLGSAFRMLVKMHSDRVQVQIANDTRFSQLGDDLLALPEEFWKKIAELPDDDIKRLMGLIEMEQTLSKDGFFTNPNNNVSEIGITVKFNESNKLISAELVFKKSTSARKFDSKLSNLYWGSLGSQLDLMEYVGYSWTHEHGKEFDRVQLSPCAIKGPEQE